MTKQMREWDVVVVGGIRTDFLIQGSILPRSGQILEGRSFLSSAGGKGATQAVAAARLGARTTLIGRLGDDERGESLLEVLEMEGVGARQVMHDPDTPTGAALIMVDDDGQRQILTAPGANHALTIEQVEDSAPSIQASFVLSAQLEVPVDCVLAAAMIARESGTRVILDPSPPRPLSDELLALIDVIRVDAVDAECLTGVLVTDRDSARTAAKVLLDRKVGAVAMDTAEPGTLLVWPGGEQWLPALPVKHVDLTGAGDAFSAALAVAMAEGQTLTEAGPFASTAAAYASTGLGSQSALPTRHELFALLAKTRRGAVPHAVDS
jgi:ribokinase